MAKIPAYAHIRYGPLDLWVNSIMHHGGSTTPQLLAYLFLHYILLLMSLLVVDSPYIPLERNSAAGFGPGHSLPHLL